MTPSLPKPEGSTARDAYSVFVWLEAWMTTTQAKELCDLLYPLYAERLRALESENAVLRARVGSASPTAYEQRIRALMTEIKTLRDKVLAAEQAIPPGAKYWGIEPTVRRSAPCADEK
jgi:hypothetical protein